MDDLPNLVSTIFLYGGIILILIIVYAVIRAIYRAGHSDGYAEGVNQSSMRQVPTVSRQVISQRDDGSIEQVSNRNYD